MRTVPVVRAALGGLSGRRVQAIVIGLVVLLSTAASTLGLGLLVESNAPFDQAFAAQHGADVTATVAGASPAQLAATTHVAAYDRVGRAVPRGDHLGHRAGHAVHPCSSTAKPPPALPITVHQQADPGRPLLARRPGR